MSVWFEQPNLIVSDDLLGRLDDTSMRVTSHVDRVGIRFDFVELQLVGELIGYEIKDNTTGFSITISQDASLTLLNTNSIIESIELFRGDDIIYRKEHAIMKSINAQLVEGNDIAILSIIVV